MAGPRTYTLFPPYTFPPSKTINEGFGDGWFDLTDGQVPNVMGEIDSLQLKAANLLGAGSDRATWTISESFGTAPGESADTALVPGTRSCRLRLSDNGVPALTHRASVEFQMPFDGLPYLINAVGADTRLRLAAPTGYTSWKDIVRITVCGVVYDFYLSGPTPAGGTPRVTISYPGTPTFSNPDTVGGHGYPYWWTQNIGISSVDTYLNDYLPGYGNDWNATGFTVPFSMSVASATAVAVKIERILSDPASGLPELCGVVDTYFGHFQMTIDYAP